MNWPNRLVLLTAALLTASACVTTPKPVTTPVPDPVTALQHDIQSIIGTPALDRGFWGIVVRSLAKDDTLFALNSDRRFVPASVQKTITLAVAADALGWDFTYDTPLVAAGPVAGGRLTGDLRIVGSGDPSIDQAALDTWADQVKAAGITSIDGGVVADASAFGATGLGFGWSWDDVPDYYSAPIAAAQFNENAVELVIKPGAGVGHPADVSMGPSGSDLVLDVRINTGAADAEFSYASHRLPGTNRVIVEGTVPLGAKPRSEFLAVDDPALFLAGAFRRTLIAKGVNISGPASATRERASGSAATGRVVATGHSAPLRVIARHLMEVSQNQVAETFLTTVGGKAGDGSPEGGLKVVNGRLAAWGIAPEAATLKDGSGLSRYNYVAPDTFVRVLTHMYRDPKHAEEFFNTLNLAGQGTMRSRLKDTPAAGNLRSKTGSMTGVRTLVGVLKDADGEPLVFAILANNFSVPGSAISAATDEIVVRLARFSRR